jgi:cholest-4-en-3-one 26-monooxygenase
MSRCSFDFTNLDQFSDDVPHDALRALRATAPVYWNPISNPTQDTDGFWLLTKHRDIVGVEKNPRVFSSHKGLTLADAPPPDWGPPWSMVRDGLAHLDSPGHAIHKQSIAPLFSPLAVARRNDRVQAKAAEIINSACTSGCVDFAEDVALSFPVQIVLGEVLGLPEEEFPRAIQWSDVIVAPNDPEFPRSAGTKAVREIYDYGMSIFKLRRHTPGDDVLSALANMKMNDGAPISGERFMRYFWSLIIGAFDTTASAIAAGMLALIRFPQEYDKLLHDPSLLPSAVEEILRWESPTIYFRRTATEDIAMSGQQIHEGQKVVMCYASANRDEDVFEDPDVFNVCRNPNEHLSFGHGPHFCLGAGLARMEIRVLFQEILRRKLRVELRGEIRRARSNFQNRIKKMPVSIIAG